MENGFDSIVLACDCGCGVVKLTAFDLDDEEISVQYYQNAFYAKQDGIFGTIRHRIYSVWMILIGKEYHLYDVIIPKAEFKEKMSKFLGEQ